ncbi:thermonuclease family protein [Rhabdaerophilum sp. SD176]|uniref:thermonuclease family protein n=1 Tax=Rhabdaerophilum sp. SD176 TaxID=2983548 RepID=UPI0024DFADB0|nr:thermonuclease family protein [Rhabdaerophilum sp. SD176]
MMIFGFSASNQNAMLLAIMVGFASVGTPFAQTVVGPATVKDGDGLVIQGIEFRLQGIDAPEIGQDCELLDGTSWPCGKLAAGELRSLVEGETVECRGDKRDAYGRVLAICRAGRTNLNRELVRQGFALAFRRYSVEFLPDEAIARSKRRGLWQGRFAAPWDWRHGSPATLDAEHPPEDPDKRPASTTIAGIARLPGLPERSPDRPPGWQSGLLAEAPGCSIKGNVNNKGEKIYHLPGMRHYGRVVMDPKTGKRWFCNEADAIGAGWRKSAR